MSRGSIASTLAIPAFQDTLESCCGQTTDTDEE